MQQNFSFKTPYVIEDYINNRNDFRTKALRESAVADMVTGKFKAGSIYTPSMETEVARVIRPVKAVQGSLQDDASNTWCIMRLSGTELVGHTFLREYAVAAIPDTTADTAAHARNGAWYIDRIKQVLESGIANWNKSRTAIQLRQEMRNYEKIYGVDLPGVAPDEAAFLARMRIFNGLQPTDIDNAIKQYEGLYGVGCLGDTVKEAAPQEVV